MSDELSPAQLRELFATVCRALTFDALRLKPREKQLALLLSLESFAQGSACGVVDLEGWRLRLASWRSNELADLLDFWRRAGIIAVDVTENTFRLAPDQFPGWANVRAILSSKGGSECALNLRTADDLHKTFAKISQNEFAKISQVAKISQIPAAIFSQNGGLGGNVSETFNRTDVKRLNVERSDAGAREICEIFAKAAPRAAALMARIKKFVGEADWNNFNFWNGGIGYRKIIFFEEADALESALNYCAAGLQDERITIKKTRGAMLWNEFQRQRKIHTPGTPARPPDAMRK